MAWVFINGTQFPITELTQEMEFDGRDVWVTTDANKVRIYSFWGDNRGEQDVIDLSSYISDSYYILKVFDQMYVFNAAVSEFVKIDITTKSVIGVVPLPYTTNCIPEFGDFKIWFATAEESNTQDLFYYDVRTVTWSARIDIAGKTQTTPRVIRYGGEGFVYVAQHNESGVAKFNSGNGNYVTSIITNRLPQAMYVNNDRDLIIAGFNGMVTSVNQTTNVATNISGLNAETESFVDDGTYIWTIEPTLSRIEKGVYTDNFITMLESAVDVTAETQADVYRGFSFSLDNQDVSGISEVKQGATTLIENTDFTFGFDDTWEEQRMVVLADAPNVTGDDPITLSVSYTYTNASQLKDFNILAFGDSILFKQVLITPTYTHEYWDGAAIQSKVEPQRVVALADNDIYFAYNLTDSWNLEETREYNIDIKGTALVGTGPKVYHGETV